jgi:two-component system response regulator HydG
MSSSVPNAAIPVPDLLLEFKQSAIRDFAARLRFSPQEGRIWLDERRMVMLHSDAFAALREELIASLGSDLARGLLTRIGYAAGCRDAELVWNTVGAEASLDALLRTGAVMHAMQGFVVPESTHSEVEQGRLYFEWTWKHSIEDEIHIQHHGVGNHPVCWFEVGYSSGYLTTCTARPILAREIECRAMGHDICKVVAKPVVEWEDAEEDLRFLYAEPAAAPQVFTGSSGASEGASLLALATRSSKPPGSDFIFGASASSHIFRHKLLRVANTNATVLLLGESGVGKSMAAREIHRHSRRAEAAFVEVNCAAIPEQLMESELFGVERGAYSGASTSRSGRFEVANGGTLFLDEIGTLSMTAQSKLLRVLQNGDFERLGSNKTQKTDVRLIAATNEDLLKAVKEGRFREDLFFRLNVFPLQIAPLRERRDDIPLLTDALLQRFATRHERAWPSITSKAMHAILHHSWPGNIRELENVLERGMILAQDDEPIDVHHLFSVDGAFSSSQLFGLGNSGALTPLDFQSVADLAGAGPDRISDVADGLIQDGSGFAGLDAMEGALIRSALKKTNGNVSKAASVLGVTRAQLDYRIKKMGLQSAP